METLHVKFKKSHSDYGYFEGDFAELPADEVALLVENGFVILFPGEKEKSENPLPTDLPCRDLLFENGFVTMDQVGEAGEGLCEIKGIGPKLCTNILDFLKD